MGHGRVQDLIRAAEGLQEGCAHALTVVRKDVLFLLGPKLSESHIKGREGLRSNVQVPVAQCALLSHILTLPCSVLQALLRWVKVVLYPLHTGEETGSVFSHLVLFLTSYSSPASLEGDRCLHLTACWHSPALAWLPPPQD